MAISGPGLRWKRANRAKTSAASRGAPTAIARRVGLKARVSVPRSAKIATMAPAARESNLAGVKRLSIEAGNRQHGAGQNGEGDYTPEHTEQPPGSETPYD